MGRLTGIASAAVGLTLALMLGACSSSAPEEAVPATSTAPAATSTPPAASSAAPVVSILSFADIETTTYSSVSGTDGASRLPWLSTSPLVVSFSHLTDTETVVVSTPCNALQIPVLIDGTVLTPTGGVAGGAMLCGGESGDHEMVATRFFDGAVTFAADGTRLTLMSGDTTIEFEAIPGRNAQQQ